MTAYTIENWLRGKIDYDIPSETMMTVLFDNGLYEGTGVTDTTEKQRDLCLADLLVWLSYSSTVSSASSDSDGGWKHTDAVKNVANRAALANRAKALYEKWNSPKVSEVSVSRITFKTIR
jgi:hypothetical protein